MRQPDVRTYLFDVARACELLETFTRGRSFDDYAGDPMLRSAVERQFEVAGEALKRALETDETLAQRIAGARRIIALHNRLIHGYATVSSEVVWGVVERHLPTLRAEVDALLGSVPDTGD
jgi:uncharacterized protein with HEPN domain